MGFLDGEENSLGFGLKVMLAAAFSLFSVLFFIILFHFYFRRQRFNRRLADQHIYQIGAQILPIDVELRSPDIGAGRKGLECSVIKSIPKLLYKQTERFDGDGDAVECSVCLAVIVEDAAVRVLPICKHVFHVDCVDTWFGSNITCPICRTVVGGGAAPPSAPPVVVESSATV